MTSLEPIRSRPGSLTDIVQAQIRDAIVSRRLAPGQHLNEGTIAEQLQVSKTPVREALLKLQYIGLIEPRLPKGLRVVEPSRSRIVDAYEVRLALECQAARLVAENHEDRTIPELEEIAGACVAAAESQDSDGFRSLDREFHLAIAAASDNPLMSRLIEDAFDLALTLRLRDVPGPSDSVSCAKQHQEILQAIKDGDPDRAEATTRAHIDKVKNIVLEAFDRHAAYIQPEPY